MQHKVVISGLQERTGREEPEIAVGKTLTRGLHAPGTLWLQVESSPDYLVFSSTLKKLCRENFERV